MNALATAADRALEFAIAPSFTRAGYVVRKRLDEWRPLDDYDAAGRTIVVTGATSGLGLEAAKTLVGLGARVVLVARNEEKAATVAARIDPTGHRTAVVVADMGDLEQVRAAAAELRTHGPIDALIHNAGALSDERTETAAGIEATVASQVVGPFLMTTLLLDDLEAAEGRVITVSSGGMYGARLTISGLEMDAESYNGTEQYARAKRAQVTLNELWDERHGHRGITFQAAHPGWADTPGVEEALPTFRRIVGRALRSPAEGADTIVWLALDDSAPLTHGGEFWHDRRVRAIHRLQTTRRSDTPERRAALWDHVEVLAARA